MVSESDGMVGGDEQSPAVEFSGETAAVAETARAWRPGLMRPRRGRRAAGVWAWRLTRALLAPLSIAGAALAGYRFGLAAALDPESREARAAARRAGGTDGERPPQWAADFPGAAGEMAAQARATGREVRGEFDGRLVVCRPGDCANALIAEHAAVLALWREQALAEQRRTGSA